jgi:hypothetical protein
MYREGKVVLKVTLGTFKLRNWVFHIRSIEVKNYFLDDTYSVSGDNEAFSVAIQLVTHRSSLASWASTEHQISRGSG